MNIVELKSSLQNISELSFELENGTKIPNHFHITEMGLTTKHFVDCGNKLRKEQYANFQIWYSTDTEHRLSPKKLNSIIENYTDFFSFENHEIEVEYQSDTIGRYGLKLENGKFILTSKQTQCLASEHCGVKTEHNNVENATSSCGSGTGCCN